MHAPVGPQRTSIILDETVVSARVMQMVDEFVMITVAQFCRLEAQNPNLIHKSSYLASRAEVFDQIEALEGMSSRLRANLIEKARSAALANASSGDVKVARRRD